MIESLYGKYIREREGKRIIEDEFGFATYIFINNECYIENVYVVEKMRQKGVASGYLDEISEIAKRNGCKAITTTCRPSANESTDSLKAILGYGFKLTAAFQDAIIFAKEL